MRSIFLLDFEIKRKLENTQYASREEATTTDLIFSLRQLIEKSWEFYKDLFLAFIDSIT